MASQESGKSLDKKPPIRYLNWRDTLRNHAVAGIAFIAGALGVAIPAHYAARGVQVAITGEKVDVTKRKKLEEDLGRLQKMKKDTGEVGWFSRPFLERFAKDPMRWMLEENEPVMKTKIGALKAREEIGDAVDFAIYLAVFATIYSQIALLAAGSMHAIVRARQRRRRDDEVVSALLQHEQSISALTENSRNLNAAVEPLINALERGIGNQASETDAIRKIEDARHLIEQARAALEKFQQTAAAAEIAQRSSEDNSADQAVR